jgi:hypothetical protein
MRRIPPFVPLDSAVWLVAVQSKTKKVTFELVDGVVIAGDCVQLNLVAGGILEPLAARILGAICIVDSRPRPLVQAGFDFVVPVLPGFDSGDLQSAALCSYSRGGLHAFAAANRGPVFSVPTGISQLESQMMPEEAKDRIN